MTAPIVLFGGTFDPVHHGHLIVARAVAERCGYRRIALLPSARPPHKPSAEAPGADRLAMLRLATAGEKLFDVCDLELRRSGPSYTFDTLTDQRRSGGDAELHWIIGADMLEDLPNWHRATEVVELARIVVASRPPWHDRLEEILDGLRQRLRAEAVRRLAGAVVATPLIDISSGDIRSRVAEGRSISFLVPECVRTYIEDRRLYAAGSAGGGPGRAPRPKTSP